MTNVPRVQFGVIFSSSSPFSRVTVISVISRVVVILETFIVVAGIVSSSSSCGSSAVRTCEDVPKKQMLPWYSRIALWSWRSITILSPLPWRDWPRCVSKSKLKKKKKKPTTGEAAQYIYTNSIFPGSGVGRRQVSPRTLTVSISKSSTPGCELLFLPNIGF